MWRSAATILGLMLVAAGPAAGQWDENDEVRQTLGVDRFVAGGTTSVSEPVAGDLIAAGGDLTVNTSVGGDLVVAAGKIHLAGTVSQDLYAAGGNLVIDTAITRNARIAGGSVSLEPNGRIDGNASFAAGELAIRGPIGGYLQAVGGRLYLDGPIGGDVDLAGERIELGPNARIAGRLKYQSTNDIEQSPGAEVEGGVERVPGLASPYADRDGFDAGRGAGVAWSLGLILAAALLGALWPGLGERFGELLRQRFAWSVLIGFIALVCIPVLVLLLLITVIGIPLGLTAAASYFVLLLAGYAGSGVAVGLLALRQWQPERMASTAWRIGAVALGMLGIVLLGRLPWVGWLIVLAALLFGMGAWLLQARRQLV